jgi:hypothetical protein
LSVAHKFYTQKNKNKNKKQKAKSKKQKAKSNGVLHPKSSIGRNRESGSLSVYLLYTSGESGSLSVYFLYTSSLKPE